ncbi:MAG: discoidin domain-containing protein [Candidatus Binatia bacterium]
MNTAQWRTSSPLFFFFLYSVTITAYFLSAPFAEAQLIPQDQIHVVAVDSEAAAKYVATNAVDGAPLTFWHTEWRGIRSPLPHQLTLDLNTAYTVTGLRYLPRQDGKTSGTITAYEIYVSANGTTWGTPVATGTWNGTAVSKEVAFPGKTGRYVRFVATAEATGSLYYTSAAEINILGTLAKQSSDLIPQSQLRVVEVDSEVPLTYAAANVVDDSPTTFWHTVWKPVASPLPHQLTLELTSAYTITGVRYLPRQDGNLNGTVTAYDIYVSSDGTNWGAPVISGTWSGTAALKEVSFPGKTGRYVRFVAKAERLGYPYTSAAEISLRGIPATTTVTGKQLSWIDNSTNEEGFKIERKIGVAGTFVRLVVVGANVTSYTDNEITPDITYCYRVQAFNAAGDSSFSNEACSVAQLTNPTTTSSTTNTASQVPFPSPRRKSNSVLTSPLVAAKKNTRSADTPQHQLIRVHIAVFRPSEAIWYIDSNSNGKFDGCAKDTCHATFGVAGDYPLVGDWTGTGKTNLGVFNAESQLWDLDRNGNNIWDACTLDLCRGPFGQANDLPVVGHWQTRSRTMTIGVFRPITGQWFLDINGNGQLDQFPTDAHLGPFGAPGELPVSGDWSGAGVTRIGTFDPVTGKWRFDDNGNGRFDGCSIDRCAGPFGEGPATPVTADWTGDGISKIGVFFPNTGLWQLDLNGNGKFDGCLVDSCLGPFGQLGDVPVVGQW